VLADALNDVLVTTTFAVTTETPWREPVTCPAVWTRRWGSGKVFVSTMGHKLEDLDLPQVRTLTERGLLWASR
jgi:type 1 glutamine amidotransferase